jgi:hypothetical protein
MLDGFSMRVNYLEPPDPHLMILDGGRWTCPMIGLWKITGFRTA